MSLPAVSPRRPRRRDKPPWTGEALTCRGQRGPGLRSVCAAAWLPVPRAGWSGPRAALGNTAGVPARSGVAGSLTNKHLVCSGCVHRRLQIRSRSHQSLPHGPTGTQTGLCGRAGEHSSSHVELTASGPAVPARRWWASHRTPGGIRAGVPCGCADSSCCRSESTGCRSLHSGMVRSPRDPLLPARPTP